MNNHIETTFDPYVVEIPHLGVTFRSALGAATTATLEHLASGEATLEELDLDWRPKFSVKYKGIIIGQVRLKTVGRMKAEELGLT